MAPHLIRRLAQKIYLLETAYPEIAEDRPRDAFLRIESESGAGALSRELARRLEQMYLRWAAARGMKVEVLQRSDEHGGRFEVVLAVEGYGAYSILRPERGIHVLEEPQPDSARPLKGVVKVCVAPQPEEPPEACRLTLQEQAGAALAAAMAGDLPLVRRYREEPAPLVRDRVRGWRTGRLDLVLAGNFDLMG